MPYPLIEGKAWAYRSGYNQTTEDEFIRGTLTVNGNVVGFEEVEAVDGETYLCAKVKMAERDEYKTEGSNITGVAKGYSWFSSEVEFVKEESEIRWYLNGDLVREQQREILLASISKGEV
jgi:hypothetical protein